MTASRWQPTDDEASRLRELHAAAKAAGENAAARTSGAQAAWGELYAEVRRLVAAGRSRARIATVLGLSKQRVGQMCDGAP